MSVRGRTTIEIPNLELDNKEEKAPVVERVFSSREEEVFLDPVNDLNSCCSQRTTDKRLIILSSQILFSSFVILFCFFKLSDETDNDDSKLYLPLLSSIVGWWLGRSSMSNDR